MSDLYELHWVILVIIGLTAVCKLICQVRQNRTNAAGNSSGRATASVSPRESRSRSGNGPVIYFAENPHGREDCEYHFSYQYVYDNQLRANTWRAYILRMPSLCGRSSDGHTIHRWSDTRGNHWVCWDSPVHSLKDIQSISRLWANSVQEYIATGKRFG